MMDMPEGKSSFKKTARLSVWLRVLGGLSLAGSALLSARLVYEETVWTWRYGPQMIGFSLGHGPGAVLLLFPLVLIVWTLLVVILTVRSLIRKNRISAARWVAFAMVVFVLGLPSLPDGFWPRVFIRQMAASARSGDLILYAAYRGDFGTVRGLISHGVKVDATDRHHWRTALHGAAASGDVQIIRLLVSKGANIDAADRFGDSPLEVAVSAISAEAAKLLREIGAKDIKGDKAQREKALQDDVADAIREMEGGGLPYLK